MTGSKRLPPKAFLLLSGIAYSAPTMRLSPFSRSKKLDFWNELSLTSRLAIPIALAQVGYISLGIVDTIMVGHLGAATIGAVGVSNSIFSLLLAVGIGLLTSLDTLVSQADGAGKKKLVHELLFQGVWLALFASIPFLFILSVASSSLSKFGIAPEVRLIAEPYLKMIIWGLPLSLLQVAFQRYWQARQTAKIITLMFVLANVINAIGNYALIDGHWGFPRMGANGTGVSTLVTRFFMMAFLWIYTERKAGFLWNRARHGLRTLPDFRILKDLLRIGLPAAGQIGFEVAVFGLASILSARLDAASAAAHQITISIVSMTFMVPLGIGAAAAVRVGFHLGAKNMRLARQAGWLSIALAASVMLVSCIAMLVFPRALLGVFTSDESVLQVAFKILIWGGLFQVFDGVQAAVTGALRGLGETRVPLIANIIGHYGLGLPVGLVLAFVLNWRLAGLWVGLATGLAAVAISLTHYWSKRTQPI